MLNNKTIFIEIEPLLFPNSYNVLFGNSELKDILSNKPSELGIKVISLLSQNNNFVIIDSFFHKNKFNRDFFINYFNKFNIEINLHDNFKLKHLSKNYLSSINDWLNNNLTIDYSILINDTYKNQIEFEKSIISYNNIIFLDKNNGLNLDNIQDVLKLKVNK